MGYEIWQGRIGWPTGYLMTMRKKNIQKLQVTEDKRREQRTREAMKEKYLKIKSQTCVVKTIRKGRAVKARGGRTSDFREMGKEREKRGWDEIEGRVKDGKSNESSAKCKSRGDATLLPLSPSCATNVPNTQKTEKNFTIIEN